MYYFLFVMSLFFIIVFPMENEEGHSNNQDLKRLLHRFQEPNKFINQAIGVRKNLINDNTKNNFLKTNLDSEEFQLEFLAYKNFFKIEEKEEEIEIDCIQNSIDNEFALLTNILKTELQFDSESTDIDSYHNLRFDINDNDFNSLKNTNIMTDNHSSKMFINKAENTFFLGDLLDRHLLMPDQKVAQTSMQSAQPGCSQIIIEDDDSNKFDELMEKKKYLPINKIFYFLKYMYLMLYELTLQTNFKIKLKNCDNSLNFQDLKYFYSLGNHECGLILQTDLEKVEIDGTDILQLARKIDKLTRFLLPTEIVFVNTELPSVYVFSHSGGMLLLPDNINIKKKQYLDFNLSEYNYSLSRSKYSIKKSLNNIYDSKLMTKMFIAKLAYLIDMPINNYNFKQKSNPFIWCDFFENITSEKFCILDDGRYSVMNIKTTQILRILYNILIQNYDLKEIFSLMIFRGHEHAPNNLCHFFSKNKCYSILDKNYYNKIHFHFLPPVCLDNTYAQFMPDKYYLYDNKIIDYINELPAMTIENNDVKDNTKDNMIKILPAFFNDYDYFEKCEKLIFILNKINNKIVIKKALNQDSIIDLRKELKEDKQIFIDILNNVLPWQVDQQKKIKFDVLNKAELASQILDALDKEVAGQILNALKSIADFFLYDFSNLSADQQNKYLKSVFNFIDFINDIRQFNISDNPSKIKSKVNDILLKNRIIKISTSRDHWLVNVFFIIAILNTKKIGFNHICGLIVAWSLLICGRIYQQKKLNNLFSEENNDLFSSEN